MIWHTYLLLLLLFSDNSTTQHTLWRTILHTIPSLYYPTRWVLTSDDGARKIHKFIPQINTSFSNGRDFTTQSRTFVVGPLLWLSTARIILPRKARKKKNTHFC
uniref:(northern house mosquito) hypothetical protein n=1 Tax=Culex pipiens TaxID=7175 RepID=A0A8D8IVD8_CULPI